MEQCYRKLWGNVSNLHEYCTQTGNQVSSANGCKMRAGEEGMGFMFDRNCTLHAFGAQWSANLQGRCTPSQLCIKNHPRYSNSYPRRYFAPTSLQSSIQSPDMTSLTDSDFRKYTYTHIHIITKYATSLSSLSHTSHSTEKQTFDHFASSMRL